MSDALTQMLWAEQVSHMSKCYWSLQKQHTMIGYIDHTQLSKLGQPDIIAMATLISVRAGQSLRTKSPSPDFRPVRHSSQGLLRGKILNTPP